MRANASTNIALCSLHFALCWSVAETDALCSLILTFIFYVAGTCDIIRQRMKKFLTCFIALACFAPAAFGADGAVTPSRVIPGTNDKSSTTTTRASDDDAKSATATTSARMGVATRSAVKTTTTPVVRSGSRTVNVATTDDTDDTTSPRTTNVTSRASVSARATAGDATNASRTGLDAAVNTVGRNARVNAASINNNPAVRRAGLTLRPTTAEVGGRAHIAGTDKQTGSNIGNEARAVTARAATQAPTADEVKDAKDRLEQTAALNKSCQEQYNECMDQFCSVVDSNQKRCSCSANLSNYTKVETAVKNANTQLNDVAQRIRYVGLSADEIRAIMTATEAEEALSSTTDSTENRSMLDEIEKLIKDPKSSTSYASDSSTGLDMDLDFSSDGDIFNLDFLNTGSSSSMSNLRGTELYNAAKKRCSTVLSQCTEVGATSKQITGNYDLAIDKDCIAYEQGLKKMNETLVSNVRSANRMLQKARLAVLQNKNQYDAKGCIGALETCMTDDMVCGDDYTKCLDPTKTYIDENGSVILGQNITNITAFMQNYNNAIIDKTFLTNANGLQITTDMCSGSTGNNGSCIVKYLLQKIGTGQKVTDGGLCRAVLDKCQAYTYSGDNYQPYNDVVVNYVQRAMVNIKAAQQQIISDYASTCMVDIASCYNKQVTQVNSWSSGASVDSIYKVMSGACHNVALTCAYAVFANDSDSCKDSSTCITNISQMFYQSLLCPDNSTYQTTPGTAGKDGYVNTRCLCDRYKYTDGYEPYGGSCVKKCSSTQTRNDSGVCVAKS